jgi:hypothetical protein
MVANGVNRIYYGIIILISIIVSLQHYFYIPPAGSVDSIYHYTHYNNYLIFRQSFFHLIQHKDLYALYPAEYYDLYKYSPTFSLLMAPFVYLPDLAGVIAWNVLNGIVLFYAFRLFPFINDNKRIFAIGFILVEAMTSLMISESNCLIAGLFILAYLFMEKSWLGLATLLIMLSVFIKPFGLAELSLFLFFPGKLRAVLYSFLWFILLLVLPLLFISSHELILLYRSWYYMIIHDHAISYGLSVGGWLHSWFGVESKIGILLAGIILFMIPLVRYKSYKYKTFRQLFLAFLLIWVVLFNHKAESPGFIIAISGVAIWFSQSYSKFNLTLLIISFVFTILSPSDLFPGSIRNGFFIPYSIKVVPCIIIWVKILFELLTKDFSVSSHLLKN